MRIIIFTLIILLSITTGYNKPNIIQTISKDLEVTKYENSLDKYIKIAPHSIQVYFYTKQFCREFNVPEEIAFSVVKLETGYRGPNNYKYNAKQTSTANAYGSYQILLSTAKYVVKIYPEDFIDIKPENITSELLLSDIKLNTKIGIKYLRHLKNIYYDWVISCGYYNTGYPIVNNYAKRAVKFYKSKQNV